MAKLWTLIALALLVTPPWLRADAASAKSAYDQGVALERAKDYKGAIAQYDAALAAEPRYAWAHRQKGTCYYMLGDKAEALRSYDAYLAVVKNDAKTQAFADRLRKELPAQTAAAGSAGRKWRVAPAFGFHTLSFKDWNDMFTAGSSSASGVTFPTVSSGMSAGVGFGYALSPAFELGLDLDYYLVSAKYSTPGYSATYGFNLLWLGPQASYTFARAAGGKLAFDAGLGLGYGMLMGSFTGGATGGTSNSSSLSGSGIGFKLGVGAEYAFSPGFGLGLDLGYRLLSVPKVTVTPSSSGASGGSGGSTSYTLQTVSASGTPKDLPLDYSGIDAKLALNFRF